jgi:putative addiction module killer protein
MKIRGVQVYDFKETDQYADWFNGITDARAKDRINARIHSAKNGNFGECEAVSEGVIEMKLHYGPGYRIYYCQCGKGVYMLLTGGTKKRQQGDIDHAKSIKRELEREGTW